MYRRFFKRNYTALYSCSNCEFIMRGPFGQNIECPICYHEMTQFTF